MRPGGEGLITVLALGFFLYILLLVGVEQKTAWEKRYYTEPWPSVRIHARSEKERERACWVGSTLASYTDFEWHDENGEVHFGDLTIPSTGRFVCLAGKQLLVEVKRSFGEEPELRLYTEDGRFRSGFTNVEYYKWVDFWLAEPDGKHIIIFMYDGFIRCSIEEFLRGYPWEKATKIDSEGKRIVKYFLYKGMVLRESWGRIELVSPYDTKDGPSVFEFRETTYPGYPAYPWYPSIFGIVHVGERLWILDENGMLSEIKLINGDVVYLRWIQLPRRAHALAADRFGLAVIASHEGPDLSWDDEAQNEADRKYSVYTFDLDLNLGEIYPMKESQSIKESHYNEEIVLTESEIIVGFPNVRSETFKRILPTE